MIRTCRDPLIPTYERVVNAVGLKYGHSASRMKAMGTRLVTIMMVWLLAGPPALCRGGMLVQCCDHVPAQSADVVGRSGCCDEHRSTDPEPQPPSRSAPLRCGSCAAVCSGATKLPDEAIGPVLSGWAFLPLVVYVESLCSQHAVRSLERSPGALNLPYPWSELPLRI